MKIPRLARLDIPGIVHHVIISGIVLSRKNCYATVVVATLLFAAMAFAEMGEVVEHYTLQVFPHTGEDNETLHAAHQPAYVVSLVMLQFLLMFLTAYFTTTIMEQLRHQENRARVERQRLEHVILATEAGFVLVDATLKPLWVRWKPTKSLSALALAQVPTSPSHPATPTRRSNTLMTRLTPSPASKSAAWLMLTLQTY